MTQNHRLLVGQLLLTALGCGLWVWFAHTPWIDSVALGLALLTGGIPHGANDLQLMRLNYPVLSYKTAFVVYISLFGLASGLMICWPLTGLLLFLMVTAYHFGQGDLYADTRLSRVAPAFTNLFYVLWGALMLAALFGLRSAELTTYLPHTDTFGGFVQQLMRLPASVWPYAAGAALLLGAGVAWLGVNPRRAAGQWVLTTGLFVLFAHTRLLFAFSVYFGIWHSLNSVQLFSRSLYATSSKAFFSRFYADALPISSLAFVFLGGFYWLSQHLYADYPLTFWLLIFIFGISVPHVIVTEPTYRRGPVAHPHSPV